MGATTKDNPAPASPILYAPEAEESKSPPVGAGRRRPMAGGPGWLHRLEYLVKPKVGDGDEPEDVMSSEQEQTGRLAEKQCRPCKGGQPPLKGEQIDRLAVQLDDAWDVLEEHHLARTFEFDDFAQALAFTNQVGELAEQVGHHPDIHLSYGKVKIEIWTHKIGGLSEADFIFAAKVDAL